jgi:type I restriction enzyme S subunit
MSTWTKQKLSEICDVRDGTHDSPKPASTGFPLVTSKHIVNSRVDLSQSYLIKEEDYESVNRRSKVDQFDLLISMIGTVGEVAFIKEKPKFAIKNVGLIKTKNEELGRYLFYYLISPTGRNNLNSLLSGSTQKFISLGKLRDLEVTLPSDDIKRNITQTLSAYDDLIENNERRIKTLEEMAQLLYTEWFVNNSKSTNLVKISDLADVASGLSYKRQNMTDVGVPLLTMGVVSPKFRFKYDNLKFYNPDFFEKKYATKPGEIIVCSHDVTSDRLILGAPAIVPKDIGNTIMVGTNLYAVFCKSEKYKIVLYHEMLTQRYRTYMISRAKGTNILFINKSDVSGYTFNIPNESVLDDFFEKVAPMDAEISTLLLRNRVLSKIRDLLIPQLVTGKRELKTDIAMKPEVGTTKNRATVVSPYQDAVTFALVVRDLSKRLGTTPSRFEVQKNKYFIDRFLIGDIRSKYSTKTYGPYDTTSRYKGGEKVALQSNYIEAVGETKFRAGAKISAAERYYSSKLTSAEPVFAYVRNKSDSELELLTTIDYAIYDLAVKYKKKVTAADVLNYIDINPDWHDKISRLSLTEQKIKTIMESLKELLKLGIKYPQI